MKETVRPFERSDVDFAMAQAGREGWPTSRAWWEALLEHDPELCLVAEVDGRLGAMVTATRYPHSAWIGNLIVSPELRRRGIGGRLMELVMRELEEAGTRTMRLDADPPGVNIYRRLGFIDELESRRFARPPIPPPWETTARPLREAELGEVASFDAPRFGDDRARMLGMLLRRSHSAHLLRRGGELAGYAMTVASTAGVHLGPCVARDAAAARELVAAAILASPGARVSIGVPAPNRTWCDELVTAEFTPTPSSNRMTWGEQGHGGDASAIFAIANGAVG